MAKNAIYRTLIPYHYNTNSELKRIALFFDKIYFNKPSVKLAPSDIVESNPKYEKTLASLNNELRVYEYLQEHNIIEEYNSTPATKSDITSENELVYIFDYIEDLKKYSKEGISGSELHSKIEERFNAILTVQDIQARVDAALLSKANNSEFYPILKSNKSFEAKGKKSEVIQFILNEFPVPDENTPWEQIIDFRSDENTRLKYLALINWINDISKSNYTLSEIKDKYEYLYLDYKKSYERHKIKSTFDFLEILAAAGTAAFTADFPTALNLASSLFQINKIKLNLLKEEANLHGKEVAYIYHSNKTFPDY